MEMLWLSTPDPKLKFATLFNMILITPIAPLQCMKLTTSLKKSLLIGRGQIRIFWSLVSFLTACTLPFAVQAGVGTVLLMNMRTLISHFMMATGFFTLVSRSKVDLFCCMLGVVQAGFILFQLLIAATIIGDGDGDWSNFSNSIKNRTLCRSCEKGRNQLYWLDRNTEQRKIFQGLRRSHGPT